MRKRNSHIANVLDYVSSSMQMRCQKSSKLTEKIHEKGNKVVGQIERPLTLGKIVEQSNSDMFVSARRK